MSFEDDLLKVVEEKVEQSGGEYRVNAFHEFEIDVLTHESLNSSMEGLKPSEVFGMVKRVFEQLQQSGKLIVGG